MGRFLVDESLPRAVCRLLSSAGHDVVDVRDIGLRGALDDEVLRTARAQSRVLLSADLDFANALRFPAGSHPGIIVLRAPDDWGLAERARRLLEAVGELDPEVSTGAIIIVEPGRTRVFRPAGT